MASLIEESKFFIEWTTHEAQIETAARLVELQVQLARWPHNWSKIWPDLSKRKQVAEQAMSWSEQVIEMSGLLKR